MKTKYISNRKLLLLAIVVVLGIGATLWLIKRPKSSAQRIVVITIDTLRADHLSCYGYPRQTSPFIDSLARAGVLFSKAFSVSSHTGPSHGSLFTSLFPFEHGLLRNHESLKKGVLNAAEMYKEAGFKVAGFPSVRFLEGKVGFPDLSEELKAKAPLSKRHWYRNAKLMVNQVTSWLDTTAPADNFLIWIHFYDVHQWVGRANIPKQYFARFSPEESDRMVDFWLEQHKTPLEFYKTRGALSDVMNRYDAHIMYVDDEIKRLHEAFRQKDFGDTTWIISSDHGEGLGNHFYEGHGEFLYNEQLHVPLIFNFGSKKPSGLVVDELVRSVDVFPTMAALTGHPIDTTTPKVRGVSLVALMDGSSQSTPPQKASFAERRPKDDVTFRKTWEEGDVFALQDKDWKYIHHTHGQDEFFNLKEDPYELQNKLDTLKEEAKSLRQVLDGILKQRLEGGSPQPEKELDPETLDELKTLGYM